MVELTDDQQTAFDFLNRKSNEYTMEKRRDMWENNAKANRQYYTKGNPELIGLTVFIIAAGPSLTRNVHSLKLIPKKSRGIILSCDVALPFLFENDIVPDYCISIDGDGRIWDMVNDSPKVDTSKVTLLSTISGAPTLISGWKGPKYFFMNRTNTIELDQKIFFISRSHTAKRDIKCGEEVVSEDVELVFGGIKPELNPGGNVTASALQFARFKLFAQKIVLVGSDFSWMTKDAFYAGSQNKEMGHERVNSEEPQTHLDFFMREVCTNMSLFNFKKIHEDYAKAWKGMIVNATEGGIFGINQDGSKMDEIEFLTLKDAVDKYVL